MQELGKICERAIPSIHWALVDGLERGRRHERSNRASSDNASVHSDIRTHGSSTASAFGGVEKECSHCDKKSGKRHFDPASRCGCCGDLVCGSRPCSSQPRLCNGCDMSISFGRKHEEREKDYELDRLRGVCATMTSVANSPEYHTNLEKSTLHDLIEECVAAVPNLKQMKKSQDDARVVAENLGSRSRERPGP